MINTFVKILHCLLASNAPYSINFKQVTGDNHTHRLETTVNPFVAGTAIWYNNKLWK